MREQAVAQAEKAYLEQLLRDERGKLSAVARRAGIGSRALYDRMRRYDLNKEDFKG